MPFGTISTTNTALPYSSSAVTGGAFCYLGHAHALYPQQGPCSVFLVMYST